MSIKEIHYLVFSSINHRCFNTLFILYEQAGKFTLLINIWNDCSIHEACSELTGFHVNSEY